MENDEILEETSGEKEELFEHFRFVVDPGTEIVRLDRYLTNLMAHTSRNRIQQAAKAGCILVNGKPEKQNYKVHPNDVITVLMPNPPNDTEILPENIPLNIVYEDNDLLIDDTNAPQIVEQLFGADVKARPKIALQLFLYDHMAPSVVPAGSRLVNSIYSTARLYSQPLPDVPVSAEFSRLALDGLHALLAEIVDPSVPFRRTSDTTASASGPCMAN